MAVDPAFENRLAELEGFAVGIQDALAQARIDLDGYVYQPIEAMDVVLERILVKFRNADLDVFLPWFNTEVVRLVELRNNP